MNAANRVILLLLVIIVTILAAPVSISPLWSSEEYQPKVVYHVDYSDSKRMSAMLSSVNNMVTTYQSELLEYDVRIVFLGAGIRFTTANKLKKTRFAEDKEFAERRENITKRLLSLKEVMDVKIYACDLTLQAIGLDKKEIYPGIDFVISGVVEIADLQYKGFSYLKSG